jgi:LEA14-like dessication related protein
MKQIILSFALLVIGLTFMSSSCEDAIKYPTFVRNENTRLGNFNLGGQASINTDLVFNNPNAFGLQVKDADLKIFINDVYVADAAQPQQVNIGARTNFTLPVTASFDASKILSTALSLLGKKQVNYSIQGGIRVGKQNLFVRVPVSFSDVYKF